ncbi:MAG: hypothetical protein VXW32_08280 [Myxococcota bacterium]|nr:hypothetical protein [Myxococcota bacterium]
MKLLDRWQKTKMPEEAREEARQLILDVHAALRENRIEEALSQAERLHFVSQNDARLHVYGHWINAKVYLAADRKRQVLRHLYLSAMAPYGTLRRRLNFRQ